MQKIQFLINSGVWGYEPFQKVMTAVRGHKYHILPTNSSPITISFAIFFVLSSFVTSLHSTLTCTIIDSILFFFNKNFYNFISSPIIDSFLTGASIGKVFDLVRLPSSNLISFVFLDSELLVFKQIYIYWIAPLLLTLGLFFLWSSNAIEEGTTSNINFFWVTLKNVKLIAQWAVSTPLFHTNLVRKGFKIGFILFIMSEVMFFFGFFWGFFHAALSPAIQIGAVWPPIGVDFITVKGFAIANTVILLTSGATLTIAHYAFELIPQRRIFLKTKNIPWNEAENFFSSKEEMFIDHAKTQELEWTPSYDRLRIVQLWRYLGKWIAEKYYSEYYIQAPFMMFSPFKKYVYFSKNKNKTEFTVRIYINLMLDCTLLLALLFMTFQGIEYFISPVNIDTGVYGCTFYMITGLHGFHVFVGTCFLLYCRTAVSMNRLMTVLVNLYEITFHHIKLIIFWANDRFSFFDKWVSLLGHFWTYNLWIYGHYGIESFECAAWYWHFVDVVWIFVFAFVYVWSHLTVLDKS